MAASLWLPALRALRRRRAAILCYHGVGPTNVADDPSFLRVTPARFRAQLELLIAAGFELVTVAELAERAGGGAPPPGLAALSFDDGMHDNHSILLPILGEYGIPATVYVTTGLIGKPNPWMSKASGARMMTEEELRDLAAAGIELGAHTVTHPDLSRLDRESCLREMVESREALERLTGAEVRTFAYPFCRYGPEAVAAVADAGFAAAVTCDGRGSWSPYELKRALIWGKDGFPSFVLKLADAYRPLFDSPAGRLLRVSTRGARGRARRRRERGVPEASAATGRASGRRYARVAHPWKAAVDLGSPHPARLYAALIGQALHHRLPGRTRFPRARALGARRGLPEGLVAGSVRALPRHSRPDLDALLDRVSEAWPELAARSVRLPPSLPDPSVLALERRSALTVFVLGRSPQPLLVLKVPAPGSGGVDREARALEEAEPARVAPRYLGRVGDARVQEALEGAPFRVEPLTLEEARSLRWPEPLAEVAAGLARVAAETAKRAAPDGLAGTLERALDCRDLTPRARRALAAAYRDLGGLEAAVLRHGDTSAQNCLFSGGHLTGLVDWENSSSRGAPGFDAWNAAVAYVEYGVSLVRWSEEAVVAAFTAAWSGSPFREGAREGAAATVLAAGVPESCLDPLEVAFFGHRLGRRIDREDAYPTGVRTAARMLEVVCAG